MFFCQASDTNKYKNKGWDNAKNRENDGYIIGA